MSENLKIKDIPKLERPREKLLSIGAETLNNSELLSIILGSGINGENILTLSQRILSELDGLDNILNASFKEITSIKGIKNVKGAQILAIAELFRRFNTLQTNKGRIKVNSPKDISDKLIAEMSKLNQEVLKLIVLNTKNNIIKIKDVFKGSLNTSIVHPREIYCEAIKCNGASIIISHNHPSGDPTPSKEDINITLRIKECGKIVGIELIDHIIVGYKGYVSLKEKGII
jgi:DNA repair protein RadC